MATTLSYIDTNFNRVYDRRYNELDKGLVTICHDFGKFGDSCLDFTNTEHKGIYFPNGVSCDTDGFVISAWIKLTETIDNFVFIGNKEDATDIDAWEIGNDSALSSETLKDLVFKSSFLNPSSSKQYAIPLKPTKRPLEKENCFSQKS